MADPNSPHSTEKRNEDEGTTVEEEEIRVPAHLKHSQPTTDVYFHPQRSVVAVGDISGDVTLFTYDGESTPSTTELRKLQNHKKSVRCVRISQDGSQAFTASKDKSWCRVDLEAGRSSTKSANAHESAIYSLLVVDENVITTGDEDGCVKMWDMRRLPAPVMEIKENDDYISNMVCSDNKKYLLTTSGDGTLSSINMKKRSLDLQSELFDSELLSLAIMKGGTKVVCGDGEGTLNIFNWGEWGNISDRYPGHPLSIDCMLPLSDDIVCTGCMDGKLRLVNILPNSIEKTFASHGEFPVQSISISYDGTLLATTSHDEEIKFWRVPDLDDIEVDRHKKRRGKTSEQHAHRQERKSFFDDL